VLLATTCVHLNRLAKVSVVLIETVIHSSRKCLYLGRVMYGLKTSLKVIYFLGCLYWKLCRGYFCYIRLYYVVTKLNSKH
jgi:hypothetical protein